MSVRYRVVYLTWAKRFSLAITLIVVVLSWLHAVKIPYIIVRGAFSFGVIYVLLVGILKLFEKTAPLPQEPQGVQTCSDSPEPPLQDTKYAGQVDPGLNEMPDTERHVEVVRRMGWDDS